MSQINATGFSSSFSSSPVMFGGRRFQRTLAASLAAVAGAALLGGCGANNGKDRYYVSGDGRFEQVNPHHRPTDFFFRAKDTPCDDGHAPLTNSQITLRVTDKDTVTLEGPDWQQKTTGTDTSFHNPASNSDVYVQGTPGHQGINEKPC